MLNSAFVLFVVVITTLISTLLNRKDHKRIMTQLDDLNAAVSSISTDLSGLATDITAVVADFEAAKAALAAGSTADLGTPIANLKAIADTLTSLDASVQAAIAPVSPVPPVSPVVI